MERSCVGCSSRFRGRRVRSRSLGWSRRQCTRVVAIHLRRHRQRSAVREHPSAASEERGVAPESRHHCQETLGYGARETFAAEGYEDEHLPSVVGSADPEHRPYTVVGDEVLRWDDLSPCSVLRLAGFVDVEEPRSLADGLDDEISVVRVEEFHWDAEFREQPRNHWYGARRPA